MQCFDNRFLYVMAADCHTIEVVDTHDPNQTFCQVIHLKLLEDYEDLMRPLMIPLNQDEICYLHSLQDEDNDSIQNISSDSQDQLSQHFDESLTEEFKLAGDFLLIASRGNNKPCPLMLVSVALAEIRSLD